MKKGQITIFIILGILLVAGAGFFLFNKNSEVDSGKKIITNPVETHIQQCIEITAKSALITVGLNGGIKDPSEYILFFGGKTPYYYGTENSSMPTLDDLQNFLSEYMTSNLKNCVNISLFPDQQITEGEINTKTIISDKTVKFNINYPIKFTNDKSTKEISEFSTTIDSRLKILHNVSLEYIKEQKKEPRYMCMTCLVQLAYKNKLKINTMTIGNTVAYNLYDNTTKLDRSEYNYYFAIKYPEAAK